MTFPDWATWGAFQTALRSDKDWTAFFAKFDVANPSGTPAGVFFVTTPVVAKAQAVSLIASWDVDPGKTEAFLAEAQPFVTLDTKLGGSVGLNIDALGDVHYEVTFDSMTSYGKFIDAIQKSTERAELTRKANEKPIANLVKFYIVETYTGP